MQALFALMMLLIELATLALPLSHIQIPRQMLLKENPSLFVMENYQICIIWMMFGRMNLPC